MFIIFLFTENDFTTNQLSEKRYGDVWTLSRQPDPLEMGLLSTKFSRLIYKSPKSNIKFLNGHRPCVCDIWYMKSYMFAWPSVGTTINTHAIRLCWIWMMKIRWINSIVPVVTPQGDSKQRNCECLNSYAGLIGQTSPNAVAWIKSII